MNMDRYADSDFVVADGLHGHRSLARFAEAGTMDRVVHGVYLPEDVTQDALTVAAAVSLRHPYVTVGLLTAAVFHRMTSAFAGGTWLLIPRGKTPPRSKWPPIRTVRIQPWLVGPDLGVEIVNRHGIDVQISNRDRTVIDLFRHSRHVDLEYALEALRTHVHSGEFDRRRFAKLADRLRSWNKIKPRIAEVL